MTKKYHITHKRDECISCGACAAIAPNFWSMNENDGLADCLVSQIIEKDFNENQEAAESCPVQIISVKEIKE